MPNVRANADGCLILPDEFLARRHMLSETEYPLDERDGDLILHPRLPGVRKIYLEATTLCNLACRTCIRSAWSDAADLYKSAPWW
jgi:hypothetical protein